MLGRGAEIPSNLREFLNTGVPILTDTESRVLMGR